MSPLLRRFIRQLPRLSLLAGFIAAPALAAPAPAPVSNAPGSPGPLAPTEGADPSRATVAGVASRPAAAATDLSPGTAAPLSFRTLAEGNAPPHRGTGAAPSDSTITDEINSRLAGDPRLEDADIRVETHDGSVVLSGRSPTDEGRQAAEEVALQVEGVTQVDNRISSPSSATTIGERSREAIKRTEEVASDSWITTKIRSAILADPLTRGISGDLGIKTVDGIVTLTGTVGTQAEYDRIIRIVHDIKGVKQVNTGELRASKEE